MTVATRPASFTMRSMAAIAGILLMAGSAYGLYLFMELAHFVARRSGTSVSFWSGYILIGLSLLSAAVAGMSLMISAWRARSRNLIPGPTLYLFGLFVATLSVQSALVSAQPVWLVGAVCGFGLLWLEYRSELI
ncbi:MAG: hypothetical protein AAGA84_03650 [Pseudomonadota bacterium]